MRYLLPLVCLIASLTFYGMGMHSGFIILLIAGVALEIGFWFGLARLLPSNQPTSKSPTKT
ncbi:hypothetical protein [Ferrimonas lipolytica]|uniref:Uncharacterized protein n=1 Tax=Ferrimonas lipolytica TaxID=2724191 RepID=A0A6H1UHP0_9GAMM|nr:hypothetical protein [Ferrimonas lipolytica]QIZ77736.1 hypothetical protein HER31_13010 [Ferrimonas lipolytica]